MTAYQSLENTLERGLAFLSSFGFERPKMTLETSRLLGDSLTLTFISKNAKREVLVSLTPTQKNKKCTVAVLLRSSDGDMLSIKDWLEAKGLTDAMRFERSDGPGATDEDFVRQFSKDFEVIAREHLNPILVGAVWEKVPFDWKGYK
jgi:hypothetical protein